MNAFFYYYRANTQKGRKKRGFLFASDLKHLKYITGLRDLRLQYGYRLPVWAERILLFVFKLFRSYRVSTHTRAVFFRQVTNLLQSGLSINKVAESLMVREKNRYFLRGLCMLHENLSLGKDLSSSVEDSFSFLPKEYQLLLSGCTDTNSMCRVFMSVAEVSEQKQGMLFSVIRMSVVFVLSLIVTVFVFIFYVKIWLLDNRLRFYYAHILPPPLYETFFQIFSGRALLDWSYLIYPVSLFTACIVIRCYSPLLLLWRKCVLHLPIIGEGVRSNVASSLFFYLDLQVNSGITLQQSLQKAVRMLVMSPYYLELKRFSNELLQGRNFDDSLQDLKVFSDDEKALLRSSMSGTSLQKSLKVIREYLDNKIQTRMLVIREAVRFTFIVVLGLLWAWAIYTRFALQLGYGI